MKKLLVVIDMQTDFTTGALGTKEAVLILSSVKQKIEHYQKDGNPIVFTKDTHQTNYLTTQEGKNLPVSHCMEGSEGWELDPIIAPLALDAPCFCKPSFGSIELGSYVKEGNFDQVELIGLCTDICVISNAMIIKAFSPETSIIVDASCCAGVTPKSHQTALEAMKMCQIQVINE